MDVNYNIFITKLKTKKISNLVDDLQACLDISSPCDNRCAEFICRFLRHLSCYLQEFKTQQSVLNEPLQCVNLVSSYVSQILNLEETAQATIEVMRAIQRNLYDILKQLVSLKMYSDVLSLAQVLRCIYVKYFKIMDKTSHNTIANLCILFWNDAARIERNSQDYCNALKLRCEVLSLLMVQNNDASTLLVIKKKLSILTSQFCRSEQLDDLCCVFPELSQRIFLELLDVIKCVDFCGIEWFYTTLCNWIAYLDSVLSYERIFETINLILNHFEMSSVFKNCSCHDSIANFNKIVNFIIDAFILKKNINQAAFQLCVQKILGKPPSVFTDAVLNLFSRTYEACVKKMTSGSADYWKMLNNNIKIAHMLCEAFIDLFQLKESKTDDDRSILLRLISSFVMSFYHLLKDSTNSSDHNFTTVLAIAEQFQRKSNFFLKQHVTEENKIHLNNIVIMITNIGRLCLNANMFKEGIPFFEVTSIEAAYTRTDYLVTNYECQIQCLYQSNCFDEALSCVIRAVLTFHSNKSLESGSEACDFFTWWKKIKRRAAREGGSSDLQKRNVIDVLLAENIKVSNEMKIELLKRELLACRMDRERYCAEESSVLHALFSCCSDALTKADVLVELSQFPQSSDEHFDVGKRSALEMCEDAIDIYSNIISTNEDDNLVKLKFSIALFWQYIHRKQKINRDAKLPHFDCNSLDLHTELSNISYKKESELFQPLQKALCYWVEIFSTDDEEFWDTLEESCYIDTLKVMHCAAEIFQMAAQNVNELKTWCLLRSFALKRDNSYFSTVANSSIIVLLTQFGFLKLANTIIVNVERTLEKDGTVQDCIQQRFHYAKSFYLLHNEKFDEGFELLHSVMAAEKSYKCRYDRIFLDNQLQELYFQYFKVFHKYKCVENYPRCKSLVLLVKKLHQIMTFLSDMKINKSESFLDFEAIRNKVIFMVLHISVDVAETFLDMGLHKKALFYLQEALVVANGFVLPYWSSRIILVIAKIDLLSGKVENCEVKLKSIELLHDFSDSNSTIESDSILNKDPISSCVEIDTISSSATPSPDSLIPLFENMKIEKHASSCKCYYCNFCSAGFVRLFANYLKCLLVTEKNLYSQVIDFNDVLLEEAYRMMNCKEIRDTLFEFFDKDLQPTLLENRTPNPLLDIAQELLLNKALLSCRLTLFENAKTAISKATEILNLAADNPEKRYPKLYGNLTNVHVKIALEKLGDGSILISDVATKTKRTNSAKEKCQQPLNEKMRCSSQATCITTPITYKFFKSKSEVKKNIWSSSLHQEVEAKGVAKMSSGRQLRSRKCAASTSTSKMPRTERVKTNSIPKSISKKKKDTVVVGLVFDSDDDDDVSPLFPEIPLREKTPMVFEDEKPLTKSIDKLPSANATLTPPKCKDSEKCQGDEGVTRKFSPSDIKLIASLMVELENAIAIFKFNPIVPLYSDLCRRLATLQLLMASLKECKSNDMKYPTSYLLSESLAVALRHSTILSLTNASYNKDDSIDAIQRESMLKTLSFYHEPDKVDLNVKRDEKNTQNIPEDWTVVHIVEATGSLDSKEHNTEKLLLCRYRKHLLPYAFTVDCCNLRNILKEFDVLMKENKESMSIKIPSTWWQVRGALDSQLQDLVQNLEDKCLKGYKGLLLGHPVNSKRREQIELAALSLVKEYGCDLELIKVLLDSASFLDDFSLLSMISTSLKTSKTSTAEKIMKFLRSTSLPSSSRHPVILILDNNVQCLPWESMPILRDCPVSRMPSLTLMNNLLAACYPEAIDSTKTFYILNPSKNLDSSQKRFEKPFTECVQWNGIIGREPDPVEFKSAFIDNDIFVYVGHGTGAHYLGNGQIPNSKFKATVVGLGCSSGRLIKWGPKTETTGVVLKFLMAGCPCIVGNLWDVTDADIDRLTNEFLKQWLPIYSKRQGTGKNIANSLCLSRSKCRLKCLNGFAPVIYGLPVNVHAI